jgi:hypothetical protein
VPDESSADPAANDPFWAPVRRRHPDVDIVLLPPEQAVPEQRAPAASEPVDPVEIEEAVGDLVSALWRATVGDTVPTEREQRWVQDRVQTTWTHETGGQVDPATAQGVVRRLADVLEQSGYDVLAPPDGLPRVQAGKPDGLSRAEVLLLVVPEAGRLVLRHRTGAWPVAR